ncbi:MAG: hypothetical protein Q8Q23_02900 [bacterium]|nr:hypothetical protein [bacterium]
MRSVLSLSLDDKTIKMVKEQSKRYGFDNVSQYIRRLINTHDDIITEDELVKDIEQARKEYKRGNFIKAKSLADFL